MRNLTPDNECFAFLDALRDSGEVNTVLAAPYLVREYPHLRAEEAKAICADWRVAYHERRTRPVWRERVIVAVVEPLASSPHPCLPRLPAIGATVRDYPR